MNAIRFERADLETLLRAGNGSVNQKRAFICALTALALGLEEPVGLALADSLFKIYRDSKGDRIFEMLLPAPIPAFTLSCTANYPGYPTPYRLTVIIDPINGSYKEIDQSERADPDHPQTWEGKLASLQVYNYFPEIDGAPTIRVGIIQVHTKDTDDLLREDPDVWSYMRTNTNMQQMLYRCFGDKFDGQLSNELVQELKKEASAAKAKEQSDRPAAAAAACANIKSRVFQSLAELKQAHALCDRR